jgi:hypothetical protein
MICIMAYWVGGEHTFLHQESVSSRPAKSMAFFRILSRVAPWATGKH